MLRFVAYQLSVQENCEKKHSTGLCLLFVHCWLPTGFPAVCAASVNLRQAAVLTSAALLQLCSPYHSRKEPSYAQGDTAKARAVLGRILQLGLSAGLLVCCLLLASASRLPAIFSPDVQVRLLLCLVDAGRGSLSSF